MALSRPSRAGAMRSASLVPRNRSRLHDDREQPCDGNSEQATRRIWGRRCVRSPAVKCMPSPQLIARADRRRQPLPAETKAHRLDTEQTQANSRGRELERQRTRCTSPTRGWKVARRCTTRRTTKRRVQPIHREPATNRRDRSCTPSRHETAGRSCRRPRCCCRPRSALSSLARSRINKPIRSPTPSQGRSSSCRQRSTPCCPPVRGFGHSEQSARRERRDFDHQQRRHRPRRIRRKAGARTLHRKDAAHGSQVQQSPSPRRSRRDNSR